MSKSSPKIDSNGITDIGPVREDNQDAIRLPDDRHSPDLGLLYAVADGMGGYSNGGLASSLALQTLEHALFNGNTSPNPKALRSGVEEANLAIFKTAQRLGVGPMGTTLTAAYIVGNILHLAHVGDSRAYLIRDGRAVCLTNDHTTVGEMVRSKIISADKLRTHAQRSVLTKALGLRMFVRADILQMKLRESDRLVLCSDGVWSVIQDEEFAQAANQSPDARHLSERLVQLAFARHTDDNASAVVLYIQELGVVADKDTLWRWSGIIRKRAS